MKTTRNRFSCKGKNYKFEPYGPKPILASGEYSKNTTYACTREGCHPTHAFAHGIVRELSEDGREVGNSMKRCANCMYEEFKDDNKNNNNNVKNVIKDIGEVTKQNTVVEVGNKQVTITNGSTAFIDDLSKASKGRNKSHARVTIAYRRSMIREDNGTTRRKATYKEIKTSIKRLQQKGLFCQPIGSRVSSGLSWPNAKKLLLGEPVFCDLIKSIEEQGLVIVNGFCHAGAAGLGGVQDYHNDSFPPNATQRSVFQFSGAKTKKMMTMIHRKEGRHVSFLTPHGSVVHLSREGAGADSTHELQHRLDGGIGSFAVILETYPKP